MPFSPLAQFTVTADWQVTPITDANYFRFIYQNIDGASYLAIAQAQVGNDGLELFGAFRFALTGQGADIALLQDPRIFEPGQRRLAVRILGKARSQSPISLSLAIEATNRMIINPTGSTSKEKWTDFPQADNANRKMVDANPDRNGGTIWNKGSKALWIGLGVNAEKSSPQKVLPGGQMEIPAGFTGQINGIFDAADPAPSAKAIVVEMVI